LSFVTVFASHSATGVASLFHAKTRANPSPSVRARAAQVKRMLD